MLILEGLPFLFIHKSEKPFIGQFSIEFIIVILMPLITLSIIVIMIYLKLFSFYNLKKYMKSCFFIRFQNIFFFVLGIIILIVYSLVPIAYLGTLLIFVFLGFLFLLIEKVSGSIDPLITGWLIIIFGIILFGIEISNLLIHNQDEKNNLIKSENMVYWGDSITFHNLFPKSEPFIGLGGRLNPNLNVIMASPDKSEGVSLITNSIGLRNNKEFNNKSDESTLRILSLGDSFSTGFSVDQNYFFGAMLQSFIKEKIPSQEVEVINAEISDPAYGALYLDRHGIELNPNIVIFGLSINDVMQSEFYFGPDKLFYLDTNGKLEPNPDYLLDNNEWVDRFSKYKYHKKGNKLYFDSRLLNEWRNRISRFKLLRKIAGLFSDIQKSHHQENTFNYLMSYERLDGQKRLFDGSNNFGFFYIFQSEIVEKMYEAFFPLLTYMKELAETNGAKFILFIHPYRYQVQPQDWQAMSKIWNFDNVDFNLRLRNKRIVNFCEDEGIRVIDPVEIFANDPRQLYLSKDVHYNDIGHQVAANEVAKYIYLLLK